MKKKPTIGIITIILGILTSLIPTVIFPVCTSKIELMNGKSLFMKCHWTSVSELLIGILIALTGVLIVSFKKDETRLVLSIILFFLGLSVLLITTFVIGMCDTASMPCRIGTEPALIAASAITMLTGIGNSVYLILSIRKESK